MIIRTAIWNEVTVANHGLQTPVLVEIWSLPKVHVRHSHYSREVDHLTVFVSGVDARWRLVEGHRRNLPLVLNLCLGWPLDFISFVRLGEKHLLVVMHLLLAVALSALAVCAAAGAHPWNFEGLVLPVIGSWEFSVLLCQNVRRWLSTPLA